MSNACLKCWRPRWVSPTSTKALPRLPSAAASDGRSFNSRAARPRRLPTSESARVGAAAIEVCTRLLADKPCLVEPRPHQPPQPVLQPKCARLECCPIRDQRMLSHEQTPHRLLYREHWRLPAPPCNASRDVSGLRRARPHLISHQQTTVPGRAVDNVHWSHSTPRCL